MRACLFSCDIDVRMTRDVRYALGSLKLETNYASGYACIDNNIEWR